MAKRKDKDAAAEGFQIPIEDANEEAAAKADAVAADEDATGQDAANSASDVSDETGSDAASEQEAHGEAHGDGAGSDGDGESGDGDDIVAEAEAIVEEASAAEQLDAAKAEAQDWQDRYMRLHAEWDTYRRRTSEQRAEEKLRATEKLVEDLLPVLDDFERSVDYATENGEVGLLDGVKAVQTKLVDALKKSGMEVIDPAGEAYDALEAQAVATVPDDEAFDETVRDVYQKGYKMGKKVLRPAMVTVTTGGPKRPKDAEAEEEQEEA